MPRLIVTRLLPASNRGDLAIALGMLSAIHRAHPEWEIEIRCRAAGSDAGWFEAYGRVGAELFARTGEGSRLLRATRAPRYRLWAARGGPWLDARGRAFVEACRASDLLVFCGGGSPGGYGRRNLLRHALLPALLARRAGTAVCFTGLGLDAPIDAESRDALRRTLAAADRVTLRDAASASVLASLGVRTRREVTADWALLLPGCSEAESERLLAAEGVPAAATRVAVAPRDPRATDPFGGRRPATGADALAAAVGALLEKTGGCAFAVPMTRSRKIDDLAFARSVRAALPEPLRPRFVALEGDYTPAQIKGVLGRSDLLVTTRLHPAVLAVGSGVPTLTIHDLPKSSGFMQLCDLEDWFLDARGADAARITAAALRLLDQRHRVAAKIRAGLPRLERAAYRNVEILEELLRERRRPRRGPNAT